MAVKNDTVYVLHISECIEKIEEFTQDISYNDFIINDLVISAVIRKLEVIGEATNYISDNMKSKFPDIPWRIMKDMRNMLIHGYFGVDVVTIWDTIQEDIPSLKISIENILKQKN